MEQDNFPRRSRSQTFRWVSVASFVVASALLLFFGQVLAASVLATMGLSRLLEATRLDERSAVAKRLISVLAMVSAVLAVIYLYTILFT